MLAFPPDARSNPAFIVRPELKPVNEKLSRTAQKHACDAFLRRIYRESLCPSSDCAKLKGSEAGWNKGKEKAKTHHLRGILL
jgi:hypothetical protein